MDGLTRIAFGAALLATQPLFGAIERVPLKPGWRFAKADDPSLPSPANAASRAAIN